MNTENIAYKGLTIQIMQDDCPEMPWKSWDGCVPFFKKSDRHFDDEFAPDMSAIIELIPRSKWNDLAYLAYEGAGLAFPPSVSCLEFLQDVRAYELRDWEDQRDHLIGMVDLECLETLEEICELAGVPCYSTTSQGYSQSHWAELLFIAPPAWVAEVGIAEENIEKSIESAADLWGAWAWGDVYGFNIESEDGDDVGSCWGFYGDDHEESGLLEHAKSDIDCHLNQQRKARLAQVKTWIKNRVPLNARLCIA